MESGLIISAIILVLVSAISKAIMDLSEERKIKGNPDYWIKAVSSNRKWKNGDKAQGERFWLSSTVLVMFTDAWHLAGFIYNVEFYENLVDSIKPAYRKLVNPTATTPVVVKGYTKDFIEVLKMFRNDVYAIRNNTESRLTSSLSALNISYINTQLQDFASADNGQFLYGRSAGKRKLNKKK